MKTTAGQIQNNNLSNALSSGKYSATALIYCLFILLTAGLMQAQDQVSGRTFFDLGIDYSSSGNGHAAFYAPSLVLNKNYNALSVAPLIYNRDNQISGLKVVYVRNLTGKLKDDYEIVCLNKADSLDFGEMLFYKKTHRDILQINFYTYLQYNKAIGLSQDFIEYEQLTNAEKDVVWQDVKVSTAEAGFGVQMQYNISNAFAFKVYSGLGAFHHFEYIHDLQNGRDAFSLNLGATLLYTFEFIHQSPKKYIKQ
ncbi:MAG: hypothetical protein WCR21_01440 [Bacteroidota bacterium]